MQNQIKTALEELYRPLSSHDCAVKTNCRFFKDCSQSIEDQMKRSAQKQKEEWDADALQKLIDNENAFFGSWNAKVGEYYTSPELKTLPMILFLGKENTSGAKNTEEPADFEECTNQHYKRTRATLAALLGETDTIGESAIITKIRVDDIEYPLHTVFALSNHYHCAFKGSKNNHGVPSTNKMWYNCSHIVKKEIAILSPDIFVIQAGWSTKESARKDIQQYYYDSEKYEIITQWESHKRVQGLYWVKRREDAAIVCCIIGSYHPCFHEWSEEKYLSTLNERIRIAREWWQENRRD